MASNAGITGVQRVVEGDKCEYCGKSLKRAKRFCNTTCSRRFEAKKNSVTGTSGDSNEEMGDSETQDSGGSEAKDSMKTSSSVNNAEESQSHGKEPSAALKWNVNQVSEFIRSIPGCAMYAEEFILQEVDGEALVLIRPEHLVMAMSMKLGPALKIVASIDSLRPDKEDSDERKRAAAQQDPAWPTSPHKKLKFT